MRIVFLLLVAAVATAMCEKMARNQEPEWYAPSRKAPLFAHKYQGLLKQLTKQGEEMRLPRDVLPVMYDIHLLPFIEEGNFTTDGYIEITIDCKVETKNISLNAAELTINSADIKVFDMAVQMGELTIRKVYDQQVDREIITIEMDKDLVVGKQYKIAIKFIAILNTDLRGFYRSSYEEDGKTKYLAVSQMEAPDARRAFPCFDEPNMKANFSIHLGHKIPETTAISNMPVASVVPISGMEGYEWVHFKPSVKMSSYLVAMMVSEFVNTNSDPALSPGVEFKIWSRPSFANQTKYAADIGPKVLNKYVTDYFNIPFPLPKVDMAAIPDFAAGAMENWGFITYREADLLYDPARSSETAKQRLAIIIAHELAHQWFGNLVTMDWWNVIWLNEGFASYMEYPGTHYVEPGFEMNEQFTVTDLHYVFGIDALESSRPIDYTVNTPSEINQMFDAISYEKGSCIIRMCANFLGEPTFRRGITRYLNKNAYGNTVQEDLWQALQEQADADGVILPAPIKTIMSTWTKQMGYPVVRVTRSYDWMKSAYVKQERFLLSKNESSTDNNNYRWWIPLTYTSNFSNPKVGYHWYPSDQGNDSILIMEESSADKWVIFNVGQEGYYRVIYDDKNLGMIQGQLMSNHNAISKKNRAQIIDDYLNLARANVTSYVTALELTRYLHHERDFAPWTAASVALEYVDTMLYSYPDEKYWKEYMTVLVESLYDYVDYTENVADTHLKIYTRSQAVYWACGKLDISDCVKNAQDDYKNWMDKDKQLSANLRRSIVCTAIANGGVAEWKFGFDKYVQSDQANEKTDLLRSITCSQNITIINDMLIKMITPDSGIRLQDANTLFSNIAANPVGHQVAIDFLTNRWNDIISYYGSFQGFGGGSIPGLYRSLCNRVNTEKKLKQLIQLRIVHFDILGNSKTVSQGLELAQANVAWVEKHYSTVTNWLKSQTTTPSTTPTTPTTPSPSSANALYINNLVFAVVMVIMGVWIH